MYVYSMGKYFKDGPDYWGKGTLATPTPVCLITPWQHHHRQEKNMFQVFQWSVRIRLLVRKHVLEREPWSYTCWLQVLLAAVLRTLLFSSS